MENDKKKVSECCELCFKWGKKYGEYVFPCNNVHCECHSKPQPEKWDSNEGQTHYENDGCGEKEHNDPAKLIEPKPTEPAPETKCTHCGRTSHVVNMGECPFCFRPKEKQEKPSPMIEDIVFDEKEWQENFAFVMECLGADAPTKNPDKWEWLLTLIEQKKRAYLSTQLEAARKEWESKNADDSGDVWENGRKEGASDFQQRAVKAIGDYTTIGGGIDYWTKLAILKIVENLDIE